MMCPGYATHFSTRPRRCTTLLVPELEHPRARFMTADFGCSDWISEVGLFDAIATVQAVHELRHKRHAAGLHRLVYGCLQPAGLYLVCDHVVGPKGMTNADLYMTAAEQVEALELAGFREIRVVLKKRGLILFRSAA